MIKSIGKLSRLATLFLLLNTCDSNVDPQFDDEFISAAREHLSKNVYPIYLEDLNPLSSLPLSVMDSSFIFLTGESHGISENSEIQFQFLKHLNKEFGVSIFLQEVGYSVSLSFNEYLSTGNTNRLDEVFQHFKGTFYWTHEKYKFFEDLYQLNQTLDPNNQIRCIGIDVEHQFMHSFQVIHNLVLNLTPHDEFNEIVSVLGEFVQSNIYDRSKAEELANNFLSLIENNEKSSLEFLGGKKKDIQIILNGIKMLFQWSNSSTNNGVRDNNIRDNFMYESFLRISNEYINTKFYGHFGNSHIMQIELDGTNWFAGRLNKDQNFMNKVISVYSAYKNSRSLVINDNGVYGEGIKNSLIPPFDMLLEGMTENVNFFRLIGDNSPFSNYDFRDSYNSQGGFKNVITDYFQYLVLINDGHACSPLH